MQAAGGWIYILIGIFALIYNLSKVAGQKAKQQPRPPQPAKPQQPAKDFRELLDELVLSNQGQLPDNKPQPAPAQPQPAYQTMETIGNEAEDDSELQIESDYSQYAQFTSHLNMFDSSQHPPQGASGETAFPSENDLVNGNTNTPSPLFTGGIDTGKAMIYGDILNKPKWLEC